MFLFLGAKVMIKSFLIPDCYLLYSYLYYVGYIRLLFHLWVFKWEVGRVARKIVIHLDQHNCKA